MKIRLKNVTLSILTLSICFSCSTDNEDLNGDVNEGLPTENEIQGPTSIVPGEYIVTTKEDASTTSLMSRYALSDTEMKSLEDSYTQKTRTLLSKNQVPTEKLAKVYFGAFNGFKLTNVDEKTLNQLKSDKNIVSIEPNYIISADLPKPIYGKEGISKEDLFKLASKKIDDGNLKMPEIPVDNVTLSNGEFVPWGVRWVGRRNGREVRAKVYVIDTGIAPHSDLNIFAGQSRSFVAAERGWEDLNGHGTHVSGIIGAKRNRDGIIGVCHNVRLVAIKVLNAEGSGEIGDMIEGFNYVFNRADSQDVFNFSVGFLNRFTSQTIDDAMIRLSNKIVGAIAAGNSNDDTQFYSPQRINNNRTWMVGSLDNNINPARTSSFGNSIDRWAPGELIASTWLNGGYQLLSGTSMAGPHVAGILVFRGNNTVRRRGNVTKGGHTNPVARM